MNFLKKYLPYLKNKYLIAVIVLLTVLFLIEDTSVFSLFKLKSDLKELREENIKKEKNIERIKQKTLELTTNPEALEKFARENYKMKKKDEVIYLFVDKDSTEIK
jgi:cell division protein DivIC